MNGLPLRVGVIGCGAIGHQHAVRLSRISGVSVAALSDPSRAAMERTASELPAAPETMSEDYRIPLGQGLDAVCIASPDAYHVEQALAALRAGCHVLCEKPLTPWVQELETVRREVARSGRIMAMTYQRRYDGAHRALRREILSGTWGEVTGIAIHSAEDWITPNAGTWRHDPAICPGGFFYDACGHQIDMVLWATDLRGQSVQAWTENAGTAVPIRIWGNAILSNGAPMTFHFVGDATAWRETIHIHCTDRDFAIRDYKPEAIVDGASQPFAPGSAQAGSDVEFIQMIREGAQNPAPVEDVRRVLRFTEAALRSAATGNVTEALP